MTFQTPVAGFRATCHNKLLERLSSQLEKRAALECEPDINDDEMDRRVAQSSEIVSEILKVRASELPELAVKARAAAWCWGTLEDFHNAGVEGFDTTYETAAHSIISDILQAELNERKASSEAEVSAPMRAAVAAVLAAREASCAALNRANAADEAASALYPEVPQFIRHAQRVNIPRGRSELEAMDQREAALTWPRPEFGPRVSAYDHWKAQTEAIDTAFGAAEADEAWQHAVEGEHAAVDHVLEVPCLTLRDAVLKYSTMLAFHADPARREVEDGEAFFRFLNDLDALSRP